MEDFRVYENNKILYFAKASENLSGDITSPSIRWTMYPIAIWDYVDPDYSDKQYWVQQVVPGKGLYPNETHEEIQFISDESFRDVLTETGYNLIAVSSIYYKDFYPDGGRAEKISVEDAINNAMDFL